MSLLPLWAFLYMENVMTTELHPIVAFLAIALMAYGVMLGIRDAFRRT